MTRVVVEDPIRTQFAEASGLVEVWDRTGRMLGYFRASVTSEDYEGLECPISDEEIHRRLKEGGGRPLSPISAGLEPRA